MAAVAGYRSDSVLVGRDRERGHLLAALAGADTAATTVIVRGAAGIGKTSLVADAIAEFGRGHPEAVVALGACLPLTSLTVPFIGIRSALHAASSPASGPPVPRAPELDGEPGLVPVAVDRWIDDVTRDGRRLVLTIDDLQWADPDTLDTLLYLIAGSPRRPVTVLATVRDRDAGGLRGIDRWVGEVRRLPRTHVLELGVLDRAATDEQVTALLGWPPDQSLIQDVYDKTRGHPYLTELTVAGLPIGTTHLPHDLPGTVTAAVLGAVDLLPADARPALIALAIAGRPLSATTLREIALDAGAITGEVPVGALLDEALRAGVITEAGDRLWFRHPLSAELIEAGLPETERRHWHEVLARFEATAGHGPGAEIDHALRLADHHHLSGDHDRSLDAALRAAEVARSAEAYPQELRLLRRAIDEDAPLSRHTVARGDLLRRARRAAVDAGAVDEELEIVEEILATEPLGELDAAEFALRRLFLRAITQRGSPGLDDTAAILTMTSRHPESWQHAWALVTWAKSRLDAPGGPDDDAAARAADEALRIARRAGHLPTLAVALTAQVEVRVSLGRTEGVQAQAAASAATALEAREWVTHNVAVQCGAAAASTRSSAAAARTLRAGREHLAAAGAPHIFVAWLAAIESWAWLTIGEWHACVEVLRFILRRNPGPYSSTSARFTAARLAVLQGRLPEARAHVARIDEIAVDHPQFLLFGLETLRAEMYLAEDDPDRALDAAMSGLRSDHPVDLADWLLPLAARALADIADRGRRAGEDITETIAAVDALASTPSPAELDALPPTAMLAPLTELYRSEVDRARRAQEEPEGWERTADALGAAHLPWEEAYACLRWAEALLRGAGGARRIGAATIAVHRGIALAERLRASPVEESLHRLAAAARIPLDGSTPRDPGRSAATSTAPRPGPDPQLSGLTEREREVLAHIVAGETYAQIARALFISEKTVSAHVSHLLTKTSTTNRVELARLAMLRSG